MKKVRIKSLMNAKGKTARNTERPKAPDRKKQERQKSCVEAIQERREEGKTERKTERKNDRMREETT